MLPPFLEETNFSVYLVPFFVREIIPPSFKLIGKFNFPSHSGIMPSREYSVNGILPAPIKRVSTPIQWLTRAPGGDVSFHKTYSRESLRLDGIIDVWTYVHYFDKTKPRNDFRWKRQVCAIPSRWRY